MDPQGGVELPIIPGSVPLLSSVSVIAPDIFCIPKRKKNPWILGKCLGVFCLTPLEGRRESEEKMDGLCLGSVSG